MTIAHAPARSTNLAKRISAALLAGTLAITGLSACSFNYGFGGEDKVAKEDVEKEISKLVKDKAGKAPESTECPDGLKAEEGAKLECKFTYSGATYSVDVTATSVDGKEVNYDIQVADQPD